MINKPRFRLGTPINIPRYKVDTLEADKKQREEQSLAIIEQNKRERKINYKFILITISILILVCGLPLFFLYKIFGLPMLIIGCIGGSIINKILK